jgi:hypothetical protein
VSDQLFRRTWQSALIVSCFSLTACGGGGGDNAASSGGLYQTITFDYPGGVTLAAGPATLHATSNSGLPVSFRSGTPEVCTVSGDQLTVLKADECLVIASQAGGTSADGRQWAPADDAGQLFVVLKHKQVVTFTPPDFVLSATTKSIELTASADTGLPVTFSTTTPDVCSITGSTLELKGKGSCAVVASQAGNDTYSPQTTQRFVAVDPLLLANGFKPSSGVGSGTTQTQQGGSVTANPWTSLLGGWEWCNATDNSGASNANWCYWNVSDDGTTLTSALHIPDSRLSGWYTGFNRINIFAPGLQAFNSSGDTSTGIRVTTEKALAFTLGVNRTLFLAGKPVVVNLDLGKRNNGCNVELSALQWPRSGMNSYAIPLTDFAVTNNCGLADVTATSLDSVRALPNRNGKEGATPDEVANAEAVYQQALDKLKDSRASATALLKSSDIARVRFWMYDFNDKAKPQPTDVPTPTADELKTFTTDLSIKGAITLQ